MIRTPATIAAALCIAGCGSISPKVIYDLNDREDLAGLTKFRLARSVITVGYVEPATPDKGIALSSVPVEASGDSYTLRPVRNLLSTTDLKVTMRPNTTLLQSIGTKVQDHRRDLIQQVASIVRSGAGLAGGPGGAPADKPEKIHLPLPIDVTALYLAAPVPGAVSFKAGKLANDWTYDISFGPKPSDAIETRELLRQLRGQASKIVFYAACRSATVTLTAGEGAPVGQTFSVTIADPNYVQTVAMPANGSITMHSACGVDTVSEKADVATTASLVSEVFTQAKSLLDSTDEQGKAGQ